jgi:hypothetical protein
MSRWRRHVLLIANIFRDSPRRHWVTTSPKLRRLCRNRGPPPQAPTKLEHCPATSSRDPSRQNITRQFPALIKTLVTSELPYRLPYISCTAARRIDLREAILVTQPQPYNSSPVINDPSLRVRSCIQHHTLASSRFYDKRGFHR